MYIWKYFLWLFLLTASCSKTENLRNNDSHSNLDKDFSLSTNKPASFSGAASYQGPVEISVSYWYWNVYGWGQTTTKQIVHGPVNSIEFHFIPKTCHKYYCQDQYQLKTGNNQHIIRISVNEYKLSMEGTSSNPDVGKTGIDIDITPYKNDCMHVEENKFWHPNGESNKISSDLSKCLKQQIASNNFEKACGQENSKAAADYCA